jgi:TonB-dependent receptor
MSMVRLILLFCMITATQVCLAQKKVGAVVGFVKDKSTGEPLPGATVSIKGTTIGEATDQSGSYFIVSAPAGLTTFEVRFIGYEGQEIEFNVEAETLNELNFDLEMDVTSLAEIVVTSQALGQAGAINQQISSSTIVNVVSKDKIRELPDQNAAETVGRISGIYVQRDAGEGQKIVVRGLAPKFNNTTINGLRIPSTDPSDRSVDLSMISPDMLSGIEVSKALRPDQDGDAIGGAVNFQVKKASEERETSIQMQYGYNSQQNEFGQYKGSFNFSDRFFNNKFGAVITGNYQRANRSSDQLRAGYLFRGQDVFRKSLVDVEELTLADIEETRIRYGGSATLDYRISDNHSITWSNLYGHTDRDEVRRRRRYRWSDGNQEHDIRDRKIDIGLLSTSLSGEHTILSGKGLELTWQASYSRTNQETPNATELRFRETSAFRSGGVSLINQPVDSVISLAYDSLERTFLQQVASESDETIDEAATLQLDIKKSFSLGGLNGYIKFGGKLRDNNRTRQKERYVGNDFGATGQLVDFLEDYPTYFTNADNDDIFISNFLSDFSADDFLDGRYFMGPGKGLRNGPGIVRDQSHDFARALNQGGYLIKDFIGDVDDYEASEKIYATYAFTELHPTQKLMLLAGVRFERTVTSYRGKYMLYGTDNDDGLQAFEQAVVDSTGGRNYNEWLPMVHLKYKVNKWFDVRAAVTKTLSRPDFTNLIPLRKINNGESEIVQADPLLLHTTAWNYDLFFSFYNKVGLFTVGGFYKQLQNIDYNRVYTVDVPGDQFIGFQVTSPVNAQGTTSISGVEVDMQVNFRTLPSPFNYFLLNANVTWLRSETLYPSVSAAQRSPEPPFGTTQVFGFREGRAPRQANIISNVALGYEKGGFSGRISMVYQGDTFATLGQTSALDSFTEGNTRLDLSIRQKINPKLSVYANWNNFTNAPEESFLGDRSRPTSEDYYGFTADLGVQYKF